MGGSAADGTGFCFITGAESAISSKQNKEATSNPNSK